MIKLKPPAKAAPKKSAAAGKRAAEDADIVLPTKDQMWDLLRARRADEERAAARLADEFVDKHMGEIKRIMVDPAKWNLNGHPRGHPRVDLIECPLELTQGVITKLNNLKLGYLFTGDVVPPREGDSPKGKLRAVLLP